MPRPRLDGLPHRRRPGAAAAPVTAGRTDLGGRPVRAILSVVRCSFCRSEPSEALRVFQSKVILRSMERRLCWGRQRPAFPAICLDILKDKPTNWPVQMSRLADSKGEILIPLRAIKIIHQTSKTVSPIPTGAPV